MRNDQLLIDLHASLWASLRQVFNTDRILLGATYAINLAGFLLLWAVTSRRPLAAVAAVAGLLTINGLIQLSFRNSRREVLSLLQTLVQLYNDHELGQYFDESKLEYYSQRYKLWLVLVPSVCVVGIAMGVILGL